MTVADQADGAHIGTYALVAFETQIAGYERGACGFNVDVLCGPLRGGMGHLGSWNSVRMLGRW